MVNDKLIETATEVAEQVKEEHGDVETLITKLREAGFNDDIITMTLGRMGYDEGIVMYHCCTEYGTPRLSKYAGRPTTSPNRATQPTAEAPAEETDERPTSASNERNDGGNSERQREGVETGVVRGGSSEDPNREATADESTTEMGKEKIKYIDVGTGKYPVSDEIAVNCMAAKFLGALNELVDAAEDIASMEPDLKNVSELLKGNESMVEAFFQINLILKGFLVLIEGEEWERALRTSVHTYPEGVQKFLHDVHDGTWNVKPKPPKIVNIE